MLHGIKCATAVASWGSNDESFGRLVKLATLNFNSIDGIKLDGEQLRHSKEMTCHSLLNPTY